jgi:two-component system cell cycle sensor histidine kinase/response regulator CckA
MEHIRDHLTARDVLSYAEDRADGATCTRIRGHLESGCRRCAQEVAFWARLLCALRPEPADLQTGACEGVGCELQPEEILQRAMAAFDQLAPQPSLWERIVSGLTAERKRAGEAARESQTLFQLLFARNPQPMWLLDLQGLRFLEVNEAAVARYGYSRAEFLQLGLVDLQIGQSPLSDDVGKGADRRPPELQGHRRHRLRDGTVIEVEINAHAMKIRGGEIALLAAQDITTRKRAEAALRRSEARYRSLIQGATYGIYRASAGGRFLDVNPALARMLGYDSDVELLEADLARDIFRDTADYTQLIEQHQHCEQLDGVELDWKRKDGEILGVRLSGRAVRDEYGALQGYEVIVEDVTERRALEEQLRQSQKMDALGRLAGGVAHDFNNLLAVIYGYSDLLQATFGADGAPRFGVEGFRRTISYTDEIRKACDRASSLTRQLLALSRKQVLQPQVVDLNAVVINIEKMLRRLIGEDIDLAILTQPDLGRVEVDPGQVDQVIINLAVNARDAMPEGGRLTIELANVELDGDYAQRYLNARPGQYVMLAVSDTGCGMDRETQSRAFEPFFTTKAEGKGTGLGLATVFGIIKQSGGDIHLYSEPGRGTTFKIYLPRIDVAATAAEEGAASDSPHGSETVLVVEDDEGVRKLVVRLLQMSGYRVLEAGQGDEALLVCARHQGPIDLLISDGVMPGMSGAELAARLTSMLPELKVLFMSGYTDGAVRRHGMLDPEMSFVQKPFKPGAMLRKVRDVLDAPGAE